MSAVINADSDLRHVRSGISTAEAMSLALCMADAPAFSVTVAVMGHFPTILTSDKTLHPSLDAAMAEVVKARLPELLEAALARLRGQEAGYQRDLAIATLDAIGRGER